MQNIPLSKKKGLREYINRFIHEGFVNHESKLFMFINDFIVILIFVSILSIILESVTSIAAQYQLIFDISDRIIVFFFTLEYIGNICAAKNKRKYIFSFFGIIDLLAIIPTYITGGLNLHALKVLRILRVLRFLRMMRLLRLLKLTKQVSNDANKEKKTKNSMLIVDLQIYFIALFTVLITFSTAEFYIESNVPNTLFTSIPAAMRRCITTITTVGYGDMVPSTVLGKIVGGMTMLCGVALFGLLMNVIGKSMMSGLFGTEEIENVEEASKEAKESLEDENLID